MREIMFRGKTIDGKEWIYGNYNQVNGKHYINSTIGDLYDTDYGFGFVEVIPETVGQYTGLEDKNGAAVYEGDIVKDFGSGTIVFETENMGSCGCCYPVFNGSGFMCEGISVTSSTVIGNVHDKPNDMEE